MLGAKGAKCTSNLAGYTLRGPSLAADDDVDVDVGIFLFRAGATMDDERAEIGGGEMVLPTHGIPKYSGDHTALEYIAVHSIVL